MSSETLIANSHPTVAETATRLWNSLPSLWKTLIPAVVALLIVLVPANVLISSRFFAITTDNLRAQHQATLADIGSAFEEFIGSYTAYLLTLADNDKVRACAATGCTAEAESLFGAELSQLLREPGAYYTEVGFIDLNGKQTARAIRGSGGSVAVPGDGALFTADADALRNANIGQVYIFPITRDPRISSSEAYQQPVVRLAMPVFADGDRKGYVTAVIALDDLFAQNFVYSDVQHLFLLDTNKCLLASSDDVRRAETYKTWSSDPTQTCYTDLQLQDWDTTVQRYHDTIISTRVIHGALSSSGQTWSIVVQQSAALAYAQANTLQTLLAGAHIITLILVILLISAADRATRRLLSAARRRDVEHARDIRFNPYVIGTPIEDKQRFFGRSDALARVIGAGVMAGDDVLIAGDRRIGKTSLLRQVESRLRERSISDPTYSYWPVALNLQGVTADVFYATLIDQILRDVPDHATRTKLRYHKQKSPYGVEDFREDIAEVLDLPGASNKQSRIILCLDNIHVWFGGTAGYDREFIDTFRAMLSDVGNQLKLIATGTHVPEGSLGRAITVVTLGPLTPDSARRLVREPVAGYYTYADDAVNQILAYSDSLPAELQRLGSYAVQFMLEQDAESITAAQVDRALQRALADWEPTYRLLWNGGVDKAGNPVERLNDALRAKLTELSTGSDPLPASYLPGESNPIARAQLDDITYTDAHGEIRLTTPFKMWLSRLGR